MAHGKRRLILVTGLSGAGKSSALKSLEDLGFEAVDNAPLRFITALAAQAPESGMVVGTDARARDFSPEHFLELLAALRSLADVAVEVLFLDCDDTVLQRRYTETRRKHPLAQDRPVMDGITAERQLLGDIRAEAETVIDTSDISSTALRQLLQQRFGAGAERLTIQLVSFSFRQGLPREADLVFDARFLRNPHYDPILKPLNGTDPRIGAYVEEDAAFAPFFDGLCTLLLPLLPRYLAEGKSYLTIAVGCTGGKHRSVHTAQKLAGFLEQKGYKTTLRHRDLGRE